MCHFAESSSFLPQTGLPWLESIVPHITFCLCMEGEALFSFPSSNTVSHGLQTRGWGREADPPPPKCLLGMTKQNWSKMI